MSSLNQEQFRTAANARLYLEKVRWPNGPVCPHCGSVSKEHYKLQGDAHRDGLYKCRDCREQFSVTVGTVFERSKIALHVWLQAVYLLCSSKKGISSHQLHRLLGVTYKTAWFMTHRIREAMTSGALGPVGGGGKIVEADETYFGTEEGKSRRGTKGGDTLKAMNKIFTLVERKGRARSFHVPDVTGDNLKRILVNQLDKDSHLMTDSSPRYNAVKRDAPFLSHEQVNHQQGEYVRGIATTNTVEGYFSILKRGLVGTYHHVGTAHLFRYTNEFDFRYNTRTALGYTDKDRTNAVLKEIGGKRLTYKTTRPAAQ